MDAMRAMREAKYARQQAGGTAASAKATTARRTPVAPPAASASAPVEAGEADSEELCGHRNMGGKTCTREAGHAAKNHRYS